MLKYEMVAQLYHSILVGAIKYFRRDNKIYYGHSSQSYFNDYEYCDKEIFLKLLNDK